MSEPDSGSDAFALTTTAARRDGDAAILNGSKTFVTNAPESDLFVLFATTDRNLGFAGLCAFLVERDTPGPDRRAATLEDGACARRRWASSFSTTARFRRGALLGSRRAPAWRSSTRRCSGSGGCILASVGRHDAPAARAVSSPTPQERKQFGKPIGSFQAVSHRIVDMKLRLETARLMLYRLAWLLDAGAGD